MKDLAKPFGSIMGASAYYQHFTKSLLYTSGIKEMADALKCHWLIDIVASYQVSGKLRDIPYQTWKAVAEDSKAVVRCFDSSEIPIVEQDVKFTTLPDGEITMLAVWQDKKTVILALPVEG